MPKQPNGTPGKTPPDTFGQEQASTVRLEIK
jgi:hypothetical protein